MADGKIEIELDVKDSKAQSQGKKAGDQIAKGVESGLKNVGKSADSAAKDTEKSFQNVAKNAKSSFSDVGSAAKNSFGDVGDAAKTAAGDASSAFEEIPADASGAFADVSSEAEAGFDGVADSASTASSDASSAFESIPSDAAGSFADVSDEARSGFDGVADAANSAAGDAASAFQQIPDAAEAAGDQISEALTVKTVAAGNILADAFEDAAGKVLDIGKNAIDSGMSFDKAMSQVAATMGVTTDEIGQLRDFAKEMGETTSFSASEAAEALNYMALAGYDADTAMRMLPTVLNLAAAGNMDLARASDMVTDAQSAFGLSVEETEEMVDKMARTSSKSNTSVEQLGDAFLTVGGLAKNLSGGTTELSQVLGVLADNGTKGAEGGTALRNVILSLSAPTDKAADAIKDLGIEIFDAQGNMRPLPEIFQDFNTALNPLTQEEKTNVLNNIFNKVDLTKVQNLLGTSAGRFDELASSIDNAQGSAQKMADTQLDNLAGDVTLLESATEGFFIAVSDQLAPTLRDLTQYISNKVLPFLTDVARNFDKIAPFVVGAATAIAGFVAGGKILRAFATETSFVGKAVKAMGIEFKTATTAQKLAAVQTKAFSTALKGLQSAGILLAITALVEAITYFIDKAAKAKEHAEKYDKATRGLEDAASGASVKVNEEASAFSELGDAVDDFDIDEFLDKHAQLADKIRETSESAQTNIAMLSDYGDAIEELAGRSDLTDEELAKLKIAVDQVNESCDTSYEVVQDSAGAYQIMADGATVAKDEILKVIDAQKLQMQTEADMANYQEAYTQWTEDQKKLAEAKKKVQEATEKLGQAEYDAQHASDPVARAKASADMAKYNSELTEATKNLEEVESTTGATESAMNKLDERTKLNTMAAEDNASAMLKSANANERFKSGVQGMDVDLVGFTKALEEMGFTSEQISKMSQDDAMKLAGAWNNGYDEFKDATKQVVGEVPAQLESMGKEAYDKAYVAGKKEGSGFHEGLSSETQAAIKAALDVVGVSIEEFDKAAEEAGIEGDEAAIAFAESIADQQKEVQKAGETVVTAAKSGFGSKDGSPEGAAIGQQFVNALNAKQSAAKTAGTTDASAAKSGLGSKDGTPEGTKLGQEFATGLSSKSGASNASGKTDANAAATGLQSQNQYASSWGNHMGTNFAAGLRGARQAVNTAASGLAQVAKDVLGHSVPKKGILREGGRGEAVWGEHLVMNIAEGMTGRRAVSAIRNASKAVAVDINDTLLREMDMIDPMAQLQESMAKGSAAFSMSAMMVGAAPTYTTNNQTNNFNAPVQSPDIIAREMRLQAHYGLAGKY